MSAFLISYVLPRITNLLPIAHGGHWVGNATMEACTHKDGYLQDGMAQWIVLPWRRSITMANRPNVIYAQDDQATQYVGNQYSNCPSSLCHYVDMDEMICFQPINCEDVPEHLKMIHGIKKMARDMEIPCGWLGCGQFVQRHNFTRHIREIHLGHARYIGHNDTQS
ncbi:hypothetical protein V8B97DRAFT_1740740 [Scleroderma yunnanense]